MPVHASAEAFKTSDGQTIYYRLRRSTDPHAHRLVLIHPLGLDSTVWNAVADSLAGNASVLTYDCRGHGRSQRNPMHFTIPLFARDLAELLEHVDWPVVTVAGCSMGGCVALGFAGEYPRRLNGLGLIDTTAWYGKDASKNWAERAASARDRGLAGMIEFQTLRWFSDGFRTEHSAIVDSIKEIFLANDVSCYGSTCVMLGNTDLRWALGSLRVPAAIVVGEEDYATPLAMSQHMHESINGSTLTVLPGVRHLAPVEAPERVSSQLVALLKRVNGGSR